MAGGGNKHGPILDPRRRTTRPARSRSALTLKARYVSRVDAVGPARLRVAAWLDDVDETIRAAAVLMVSELATNAVIHSTAAYFEVALERSSDRIVVSVTDDGGGTPVVRAPAITDPTGRGLRIVAHLADRFGIELSPASTKVWFELTGATGDGAPADSADNATVRTPGLGWWHDVDRVDTLAARILTRRRAAQADVEAVVVGVLDEVGDVHIVSTDRVVPPDVGDAITTAVERGRSDVVVVPAARSDRYWFVRPLDLDGRCVGAFAWDGISAADGDDNDAFLAELALSLDVVVGRQGGRQLRKHLRALRVIGREISQALTARDVAACAEREARHALAARSCYVYQLVDDDLVLAHDEYAPAEPWSPISLSASTPVSDCVRSGTSLHCRARSEILERYPWAHDHSEAEDQAWAAVPLTIERQRIGALFLSFAEARNWTPDELDLAATIADQCAQAFARIALQEEIDSFRSAQTEHRFQSALDAMFDLVTIESAVRDAAGRVVDFRIDYMNQADIDVAGRAAQDLTGHLLSETYPAAFEDGLFEGYVRVVESGETLVINDLPYTDTIDGAAVSGHYGVRIAKFGDGIIISARAGRLDNTDPPAPERGP